MSLGTKKMDTDDSIIRNLFQRTMVTMIVAELSGAASGLIDGIMIGQFLGERGLAVWGIGSPYFSIVVIVSGIMMVGSTNLCNRAVGNSDKKAVAGIFSLTMVICVLTSFLMCAGGILFSEGIAVAFGAGGGGPEVVFETSLYLRGMFFGTPGFMLVFILTPLVQLDGSTKLARMSSVVYVLADITLDLANVFIFHGGIFGMAMATSISYYLSFAVLLCHFLKKERMLRFSLRVIDKKMTPRLLKDGIPMAVSMLCRALLPIILNGLVFGVVGETGVAALSAQSGVRFGLNAAGWGIGGAVLIVGGLMLGEQNINGLRTVFSAALKNILTIVCVIAAAAFFAAPLLAALFIPQPGIIHDMAVTAIRCYAISLPLQAINTSIAQYFQAIPRMRDAILANIMLEVVCISVAAFIMSHLLGIMGIWLAFPVGQLVLLMMLLLRLAIGRDYDRSGVEQYFLLPPDFGVAESDCIGRAICSTDEAVSFSKEIVTFCEEHSISKKAGGKLALCAEELCINVIEHGFSDGKGHHLYALVIVKDGKLTLRMRDDCTLFDLEEKANQFIPDTEHPEKRIGIRLIKAIAEDISYASTMNTNNLIVVINEKELT